MGMYDNLIFRGQRYQTKDFDCEMRTYYLDDNQLYKSIGHYENVARDSRPFPDEPEDSLLSLCGCIRWVEEKRSDMNFHGILHFGRIVDGKFEDYEAKITDGSVVAIKQTDKP